MDVLVSCVGQRLGEGPGRTEFLQLGPVLELWLLFGEKAEKPRTAAHLSPFACLHFTFYFLHITTF